MGSRRTICVYEKHEFQSGREALIEYWKQWLDCYMQLYRQDVDLSAKKRAIPPPFCGRRINILISSTSDGFTYLDLRRSYYFSDLIKCASNPEAYSKSTVGLVQQCYTTDISNIMVFTYEDPNTFPETSPETSKIISETMLGPKIHIETTDPVQHAKRMYSINSASRSNHLSLLEDAIQEFNSIKKGKKLESLLHLIINDIPGFIISGSDVRTQTEEIDIVVQNESTDYPWVNEGTLILFECKNWSTNKVGVNAFKSFKSKIDDRYRRAKLGFLITTGDFTSTITKEMLRYSTGEILIVPVNGHQLRELANTSEKNEALKKFFHKALLT